MPEQLSRINYQPATQLWPGAAIYVNDQNGQQLCGVPLGFLLGGQVEPCSHLKLCVGMCVNEEGSLFDADGAPLEDQMQLQAESTLEWRCTGE